MTKTAPAFRLAMRVEGQWWVAYFAKAQTMEGAIEMGRIALTLVQDENRKRAFMEIMKSALGEMLEQRGARIESWNEEPAPESERSGSA